MNATKRGYNTKYGVWDHVSAIFDPDAQICASSHQFVCIGIAFSCNLKKISSKNSNWFKSYDDKTDNYIILSSKNAIFNTFFCSNLRMAAKIDYSV